MLTRRALVRRLGLAVTPLYALDLFASPETANDIKLSVARVFPKSSMLALSPDGTKVCLEDWNEPGYPVRVLGLDDWNTIYAGRFASRTLGLGFFADSEMLLVHAMTSVPGRACGVGKDNCAHEDVILDLRTANHTERMTPFGDLFSGERYYPLSSGTLLAARFETKPYYETTTLALIRLPDYREIAKLPYATQPRKPRPIVGGIRLSTEYGFAISDDRNTLAYSFDDVLLCRKTEDLAIRWTRRIEPELKAYSVVVSASGAHVAAAIADSSVPHLQRMSYIAVYDGRDGRDVARMQRSGTEGMALSPDGRVIAIVTSEPGSKREIIPTVHIHELPSGRLLTSVIHDHIKSGRHQRLEAGCTVAFTSDGKYMITSGMSTKIWKLDPSA